MPELAASIFNMRYEREFFRSFALYFLFIVLLYHTIQLRRHGGVTGYGGFAVCGWFLTLG